MLAAGGFITAVYTKFPSRRPCTADKSVEDPQLSRSAVARDLSAMLQPAIKEAVARLQSQFQGLQPNPLQPSLRGFVQPSLGWIGI